MRSPPVEPYSQLAAAWHEHGTVFLPRYGRYVARLVASGTVRPGLALDLACGTGITAEALAPLFERVYAVDRNEHMLRVARSRRSHPNVEYITSDFSAPLPGGPGRARLLRVPALDVMLGSHPPARRQGHASARAARSGAPT